jgi:tetratricopeptide (TPR) repeat protein
MLNNQYLVSSISPPHMHIVLPPGYRRNPHFVGRTELLETLRHKLRQNQGITFNHRVALYGMGGVGKTQVALEYVFKFKSKYKSIFWITAEDLTHLQFGFQEIAQSTQCVKTEGKEAASLARDVLGWLEKQNSWLLVLDNVDDTSIIYNYLPDVSAGNGNLLITMRNPDVTSILAQGLEVGVFEAQTATEMLLLRSDMPEKGDDKTKAHAMMIVQELGFLALAIEQAAAFIRVSLKDISKFMAVYTASREKFLHERPAQHWNYPHVVATTWSMSFGSVKERNRNAAELLNLFAFLNPDGILVEFLERGRDGLCGQLKTLIGEPFEFMKSLGLLEQYSLIRRSDEGRMISIHRLVQAVIRDNLALETEKTFMDMTLAVFLSAFPVFEENKRQICRKYQAQVLGPLHTMSKVQTEDVAEISNRMAHFLSIDGKFHDAQKLAQIASDIYRHQFGAENSRTLTGIANLAVTYRALGQWMVAMALQEQVVEARRRMFGDEDLDTLTSMSNLAPTYRALGRTKDAADLQEWVLKTHQRILEDDHPDMLRNMNNLAETYVDLGRMREAATLHGNVLEVYLRILGDKHPDTLTSMNNLALIYVELGHIEKAEDLQNHVLEARQKILGDRHPDTLTSMNNRALIYEALGQTKEAVDLHQKVLEARWSILGDEHPDTLRSMGNLAGTYHTLGQMNDAVALQKRVLEAQRRFFGDEHPDTLRSMNNLALTYDALGQTNEATDLHEKALEARQRILGDEHLDTLTSMYNLATTYWNSGRQGEAVKLYERELEVCHRLHGAKDRETLISMRNLVERYCDIGHLEDAATLALRLEQTLEEMN